MLNCHKLCSLGFHSLSLLSTITFHLTSTLFCLLFQLQEGNADIAFGSLPIRNKYNAHFVPSVYFMETPVRGYFLPVWKSRNAPELFIECFQWPVWLGLTICFLSAFGFIGFDFLNFLLIVLGLPTKEPQHKLKRFVFLWLIVMLIIVRAGYMGTLFQGLGTREQVYIDSEEKLLELNFTALLTKSMMISFGDQQVLDFKKIPVQIEEEPPALSFGSLEKYTNQRYIAFGSSVVEHYHYSLYKKVAKALKLPRPFYYHQNGVYFRKNSFIKKIVNTKISWMRDTGLIAKIRSTHLNDRYSCKIATPHSFEYNDEAKSLEISQIHGLLLATIACYAFTCIVFICEIIWFHRTKFIKHINKIF